jgi:hypothetical protein
MGLAGIGLPEHMYMLVARHLYDKDNSIICPSASGHSCHAEQFCSALIDSVEGLHFKITADGTKSFELPTTAIMR